MEGGWFRLCDDKVFLKRMTEETILGKEIVLPHRFATKMVAKVKRLGKLVLDVHGKGCWTVYVKKVGGRHCIVEGWDVMVSAINLTTSHTLLFEHLGDLKLKVYAFLNEVMDLFGMMDNSAVIPLPGPRGNGRGRSANNYRVAARSPCPVRTSAKFSKTVESTHTKYHKMAVPKKFTTTYAAKLQNVDVWNLKVEGNNTRTWFVRTATYNGKGYLQGGWHEFVKDNAIEVGDRYDFRVIKWGSPVLPMKVTIARWKK